MTTSLPTSQSGGGLLARVSLLLHGGNTMEQGQIKVLIGEIMTVSALLAGFSMAMVGKLGTADVRAYAEFLKSEFFGKHSQFCDFVAQNPPSGFPPIGNGAGVPNGTTCSADGCWIGHWATNNAAEVLGHESCSLSVAEMKATYPTWWSEQVEEKVIASSIEVGYNSMIIIMSPCTPIAFLIALH